MKENYSSPIRVSDAFVPNNESDMDEEHLIEVRKVLESPVKVEEGVIVINALSAPLGNEMKPLINQEAVSDIIRI
jgi:hypothetical protein